MFHQGNTSTPAASPNYSQLDRLNTFSLIVNGTDEYLDRSEMNKFSMSTNAIGQQQDAFRKNYQQDVLNLSDYRLRPDLGGYGTPGGELEAMSDSTSQTTERSFLWSTDVGQSGGRPKSASSRPSFRMSAFGTPEKPQEKSSVFGKDYQLSPYYKGKTTFGGSAAHNSVKFKQKTPYRLTPSGCRVKAQPLKSSRGGITSSTSKRILDTLDRLSANDTRKMLSVNSCLLSSFTKPIQSYTKPIPSSSKPDESDARGTTGGASGSRGGRSGKMRREKAMHYSTKHVEEEEEVENPDLPTDFVLSLGSMPKFDFSSGQSTGQRAPLPVADFSFSSPISTEKPQSVVGRSSLPPQEFQFSPPVPVDTATSSTFSFSSPISTETPDVVSSGGCLPPQKFRFSAPMLVDMETSSDDDYDDTGLVTRTSELKQRGSVMDILGKGASARGQLMKGSVMEALKPTAPTGNQGSGLKPAAKLSSGSVMDILGGGGAKNKPSLASMFQKPQGSWECSVCMITNTGDSNKCVACETPKPAPAPKAQQRASIQAAVPAAGNLSTLFKKPQGSWDCPTCMIQNGAVAEKCPACDTAKPSGACTKPPAVSVPANTGPSLLEKFKPAAGSWECPTCMIRNMVAVERCPACDTVQPRTASGTIRSATAQQSIPKPTGPGFGDLFKKSAGSWECDTCMVVNKAENTRCIACETPRP